jgi:two-component system nitrate/nitrite sensor histidine kinase NarQ
MSYKQIKWLILIIPTLTIGIWEYIRHAYLLPYISMELGNWLSPLIILSVTMTLLLKLFSLMEHLQEELNIAREARTILEERERLARELHDGIAQSLFLLSVKLHRLEKDKPGADMPLFRELRATVRRVHEDVRQAISDLRYSSNEALPWTQAVGEMISDLQKETGVEVLFKWDVPEEMLSSKEKMELSACVREALINVRKHADARHVKVDFCETETGWSVAVEDDGRGFPDNPFAEPAHYGLRMIRERADEMGWNFSIGRVGKKTRLEIRKENRL